MTDVYDNHLLIPTDESQDTFESENHNLLKHNLTFLWQSFALLFCQSLAHLRMQYCKLLKIAGHLKPGHLMTRVRSMGQYYRPSIITIENDVATVLVRLSANSYNTGMKLMEHSYFTDDLVKAFEGLLIPGAEYHKSRVVWAGDYAFKEDNEECNVHEMGNNAKVLKPTPEDMSKYSFVVNHSRRQFVDKSKADIIHPLPLLTAEGNGRGNGDYGVYWKVTNLSKVGKWARDIISIEKEVPADYEELKCVFKEIEHTNHPPRNPYTGY